jgi:hypothetical protein
MLCRYPIYAPGCAFETRVVSVSVSRFVLQILRISSPSSILHDLIARREDWDDDQNVSSNMEGWVWTDNT